MNRLRTAALTAAALVLGACGASSGNAGAGNDLPAAAGTSSARAGVVTVVAAENFWGDIAKQIGGSHVDVTSIISDPETDPHQYETDAKAAAAITSAAVVIENGVGYDDFMGKLLAASPNSGRVVLDVEKIVNPAGSNPNPHLWYDPAYVRTAATAIEAQLATEDPAHAATFRTNLATFLAGEQKVVDILDTIRKKYPGAPVAYTERVPGYLVQAAGLTLGTPASFSQSIEDGDDPSPRDTATFDSALTDKKVEVLLYNSQVTSPVTQKARELATAGGVPVVGVSETIPPGEKDFQTWQADQARALLTALGG